MDAYNGFRLDYHPRVEGSAVGHITAGLEINGLGDGLGTGQQAHIAAVSESNTCHTITSMLAVSYLAG